MSTPQGTMTIPNCESVNFKLSNGPRIFHINGAISCTNVRFPEQTIPMNLISRLRLPENISVEPQYSVQVKLLIGQDNWRLLKTLELREIPKCDLALSRTPLGWAIHGQIDSKMVKALEAEVTCNYLNQLENSKGKRARKYDEEEALDELMKRYFELDCMGVGPPREQKTEHDRALSIMRETSRRVSKNVWETGLLWKSDSPPRVDSYHTARKRLALLEARLDRNPEFAELYYKEMQRFIDLGYARKVTNRTAHSRVWYLPHFGVYNINKPGKIRLVFDAAAKSMGISLNNQLDPGPDLLQPLPGVLLRFRQWKIAVKGDISDMFLRILVREADLGAQRFLWRGRDRDGEPQILEMTVLIFGSTSSPSSANYIKIKNAEAFKESKPRASHSIRRNSYMDDELDSCRTEEEAIGLVKDVIEINAAANFQMHGWASNSPRVIHESLRGVKRKSDRETRLCDRGEERVLGLYWDTESDNLKFNLGLAKIPKEILDGEKRPTKREVLRVIMSIFDPLGLIAPFTLQSKILMQEIWRSGIEWDHQLKDVEYAAWCEWFARIEKVRECSLPRCLTPKLDQNARAQLHIFCDASLSAYAAVAYLRFETKDGQVHISLLMAKTKVAPLKPTTWDIPKLELQAAVLGTKLAQFIKDELEIEITSRTFWSDNTTVLHWIKSEPRSRQVFVANRLGLIAELTMPSEWFWLPSKDNPADKATRFQEELSSESMWFTGPEFLSRPETEWPEQRQLTAEEMLRCDALHSRNVFVCTEAVARPTPLAVARFPMSLLGWRGIAIVARRVHRAFQRWREFAAARARVRGEREGEPRDGSIASKSTPTWSFESGERYWYRVIQKDSFADEIKALKRGEGLSKRSVLKQYGPFLDVDGIMRTHGRVARGAPQEFEKNPIILDAKHDAARFLIAEYHRKFYHGSHDTVLNELRQKFHIVGLRTALRSLTSKCLTCRLRRAQPREPIMGALPPARVAYQQRAFSHCGVDYFGPMWVKIGRRREKRWGVLFTCLTTRAIHLDLVESLSADSAILAIIRLARLRGTPLIMYSDNGTNFRAADKELKEEFDRMDKSQMVSLTQVRRIEWRFNPPDAPHMGGAWERLIRSVKIALGAILNGQAAKPEVLQTTLAEIAHTVNSRPLTHVSLDPRDPEALTPNHFLIGASSGDVVLGNYELENVCLRKQYRLSQAYANAFWKRWIREYLPNLLPRKKWTSPDENLEVGDIVLIVDLQAPRSCWRKGTVVKTYPGSDAQVRMAEVHTSTGNLTRPARKLIRLLGVKEVQNSLNLARGENCFARRPRQA